MVDSSGPGAAGFSMEGTRVQDSYYVVPVDGEPDGIELIEQVVKDTLGTCRPKGDGRLERTLPKAHQMFWTAYASAISSYRGIGQNAPAKPDAGRAAAVGALVEVDEVLEAGPITDHYWVHAWGEMSVVFESRPYKVISDANIDLESVSWYDEDGDAVTSWQAGEWERFLDIEYEPSPEWVSAQHGQLVFRRGDGTAIGTPEPHLYTFSAFPRIVVNKALVKFRWFQVPFSYVLSSDSHLSRWIGYVNQQEWFGWGEAELLYLGFKVIRRYTPPFPAREELEDTVSFSIDKLCDVEILAEEVVRTSPSVPTPVNNNWKAAGHNLAYWLKTRKAYYVTQPDPPVPLAGGSAPPADTSTQTPMFLSFLWGLLFTDPDI